ncbi:DUF6542 domain-containing protein [Saccharopolyspora hordei]|uniref:DUF6542 domain-containing protein n=1 Tax=Saccharopolyspora hordei TaxID=1838 RepID=A0A853AVA6_9PSEU|nr:DUF6542 domain-containing protein [Saccharopolyspora hordei]NYI86586.1 hypothetical protein [Saccharopolyspora hordei]
MPLWVAVLLAAVPTAIGTVLDILIWNQPDVLFKSCFFVGCVLAVLMAKRRNVFGPMVQPPLVLVVVMPLLVLITGSGAAAGAGATGKALSVARPLISSFPIMAGATVVALGIGLVRMFVTEKADHRPEVADSDAATKKRRRPTPSRGSGDRKRPDERGERREGRPARGERPTRERGDRGRPERGRAQAPGRARREEAPRRADAPRRGEAGRPRGAEGRPERAVPPRRGTGPRQVPGRPRQAEPPQGEPPRRPRRPRRDFG